MVDGNTPASVKARVAEAVLALAIKGVENEDVDVRLAALEQVAELSKQNR